MKNLLAAFTGLGLLCLAGAAAAQLPANPWAPHPNDGYFGDNVIQQGPAVAPNAPMYENNSSGGEIMPVDPWARARDKTNTQTWRGSGRHDRDLNYVGEATTYGTAMGQEMIAPEVNLRPEHQRHAEELRPVPAGFLRCYRRQRHENRSARGYHQFTDGQF